MLPTLDGMMSYSACHGFTDIILISTGKVAESLSSRILSRRNSEFINTNVNTTHPRECYGISQSSL